MRQRKDSIHPDPDRAELKTLLHYLDMHKTAEGYQDLIDQAGKGNWSHLKLLEVMASSEAAAKKDRSVAARIAQARFPDIKTIDAFDFSFPKSIPKASILAALSLQFVERNEGLIFLGEPGTGKSHLAKAIGYAACLQGVRTRFTTAVDMVNDLQDAVGNHRLRFAMLAYKRPRLLILDEVGFLTFDHKGSHLFFQVINARYEQGSTIITTNEPFKRWGEVFANNTVASAIVDRITHHNELIHIRGDSYRLHHRKTRRKK